MALAQALADTLSPDQLHRTLDRYAKLYCPVSDVFGQFYHWSLMQVEYATDLAFRSAATLGPLYEQLVRQSVLNVKAEQVATFLGLQITPLLATRLSRQLRRLLDLGVIKRVTGTYRYYLTKAGRAATAAAERITMGRLGQCFVCAVKKLRGVARGIYRARKTLSQPSHRPAFVRGADKSGTVQNGQVSHCPAPIDRSSDSQRRQPYHTRARGERVQKSPHVQHALLTGAGFKLGLLVRPSTTKTPPAFTGGACHRRLDVGELDLRSRLSRRPTMITPAADHTACTTTSVGRLALILPIQELTKHHTGLCIAQGALDAGLGDKCRELAAQGFVRVSGDNLPCQAVLRRGET